MIARQARPQADTAEPRVTDAPVAGHSAPLVLHLRDNPESRSATVRANTVKQLREECAQLRAQLTALRSSGDGSGTMAPLAVAGTTTVPATRSASAAAAVPAPEPAAVAATATVVTSAASGTPATVMAGGRADAPGAHMDPEKRYERLKKVYNEKINEFRSACYMLTGYQINMIDDQFRLYHMYAENAADTLVFQLGPDKGALCAASGTAPCVRTARA